MHHPLTASPMSRKEIRKYSILSFALPVLLVLFAFLLLQICPFGDNTILSMDLHGQYFPMLKEMKGAILEGDLFYSFTGGLGFNQMAQTAYYTNSIFWYILALLPVGIMIPAFHIIVLLKFGLAGLTFSYFLRRKYGELTPLTVALSTAYALSSYMVAYMAQIMWTDAIILLPVVLIGLEILLSERRPLVYFVSLTLLLFSNFYIGFSVCIFTALYFVVYELSEKRSWQERLARTGRFALYSLLSGGASAVCLIPTFLAIQNTKASTLGFEGELKFYHPIADIAESLMPFSGVELEYGVPNIYCGAFILLAVLLFLLNGKISLRRRILHVALLGFMMVSFELNLLDYIWHGFHYPNQLPGRQSFLFVFLALVLTYEAIRAAHGLKRYAVLIAFAVPAVFLTVVQLTAEEGSDLIWIGVALLGAYAAAILLPREARSAVVPALLTGIILFEVGLSSVYTLSTETRTYSKQWFTFHWAEMAPLTETYESGKDDLYRTDSTPNLGFNSGQLYGHKGITYYSSMMSGAAYDFFGDLGFGVYANNVSTLFAPTPVVNTMLNVKYVYDRYNTATLSTLTPRETIASTTVLENNYYLPFAFMVDEGMTALANDGTLNPLEYQNEMLKATGATEENVFILTKGKRSLDNATLRFGEDGKQYYSRIDSTKPVVCTFTYTLKNEGDYYISSEFRGGTLKLYVDGEFAKEFSTRYDRVCSLGSYPAGTVLKLEVTSDYYFALYGITLYRFDESAFSAAYDRLLPGAVDVTSVRSSSRIDATVTAAEDGLLYTTLPQDGGWRLYVDGRRAELDTVADFLLCAPVSAGEHTLAFRYTPPGFYAGLGLTLFCLAVAFAPYIFRWIKNTKKKTAPVAAKETN